MNSTELQLGFIYNIDGKPMRAESIYCREGVLYVNNSKNFAPSILTEKMFDFLGFKYYNGWYHPDDEDQSLIFLMASGGYIVSLGNDEIDGLVVKNIHEMQRLLYAIKNILV